jgi:hypothetical protein
MARRLKWSPTVALWVGNAGVWLALALIALFQLGALRMGGPLPDVRSITPKPIQTVAQSSSSGTRNPFDPTGQNWRSALATAAPVHREVRGVVIMPGVRAALTDAGVVHLGEQLSGGRVTQIEQDRVVVQQDAHSVELELPSAHRPTLQSLMAERKPGTPKLDEEAQ